MCASTCSASPLLTNTKACRRLRGKRAKKSTCGTIPSRARSSPITITRLLPQKMRRGNFSCSLDIASGMVTPSAAATIVGLPPDPLLLPIPSPPPAVLGIAEGIASCRESLMVLPCPLSRPAAVTSARSLISTRSQQPVRRGKSTIQREAAIRPAPAIRPARFMAPARPPCGFVGYVFPSRVGPGCCPGAWRSRSAWPVSRGRVFRAHHGARTSTSRRSRPLAGATGAR